MMSSVTGSSGSIPLDPSDYSVLAQQKKQLSRFPFPLVPLTPEEENSISTKHYFKFQTSTYVAYVSMNQLNYLKPEYLESSQDSFKMREARKWLWGKPFSKEAYALEGKYPYEQSLVLKEKYKMDDAWMADHQGSFPPETFNRYFEISKKYTLWNYIFEDAPLRNTSYIFTYVRDCNSKQIFKAAIITGLFISAIAICYCFITDPDFLNHFIFKHYPFQNSSLQSLNQSRVLEME